MADPENRPWWSVRISGVLRLLLIVYGVLGLPLLVAYGVSFVSHRWMTQNEKRAATKALLSVEDLKNSTGAVDNVWKIKDQKAEQLVERAQKVAFTGKDREIYEELSVLLAVVEGNHTSSEVAKLQDQISRRSPKAHLPSVGSALQGESMGQGYLIVLQSELNSSLRSELGLYEPGSKKK